MNRNIENKATGDQIQFIKTTEETNGELLEFIMTLAPKSSWAKNPRHFHSYQVETFKVLKGELHLTVNKEHHILQPKDDKVVVDKFDLHSFWNAQDTQTIFKAQIFTPRKIEEGLRLTYQLSQEGKVNKNNLPNNPFYTLVLMDCFDSYFAFIPWKLQRLFFKSGARFAKLFGYTL